MLGEKEGIILRVKELIELSGLKKSRFAVEVGINASNFGKKLEGSLGFTDKDVKSISKKMGVRIGWLLTGEGERYTLPEDLRQQVAIDTYRYKMQNNEINEEKKNEIENLTILEIYSKCIRQLEDDRSLVKLELDEIRKIRLTLEQTLEDVRGLKMQLQETIGIMKNL